MNPSATEPDEEQPSNIVSGSSSLPVDSNAATKLQKPREVRTEPNPSSTEVAANTKSDLELSLDLDLHSYPTSHYWDASTMAPLNAVSAVSIA